MLYPALDGKVKGTLMEGIDRSWGRDRGGGDRGRDLESIFLFFLEREDEIIEK